MISHYESNIVGNDFVMGDLHGQYDRLMMLLSQLQFNYEKDRLFALGDLIDRGPASIDCLALIKQPWFFSVRGNHEDLLIRTAQNKENWPLWLTNGGAWGKFLSIDQLKVYSKMLAQLPLVISLGTGPDRVNLFHAEFFGTDQDLDVGNYTALEEKRLLWGRKLISQPAQYRSLSQISKAFCGHSVVKKPLKIAAQIFIDTGAGFIEQGVN
jgi:serine/threonine protein phosphatase 1